MTMHTAANAVPPLDGELEGLLEDLAAVQDPGIDQIIAGIRYLVLARHSIDHSQTLIAAIAGGGDRTNLITALGKTIARLSDPATNPSLRTLPEDVQKNARREGVNAAYWLSDPDLHQTASETCAAITGT